MVQFKVKKTYHQSKHIYLFIIIIIIIIILYIIFIIIFLLSNKYIYPDEIGCWQLPLFT